MMTKISDLYGVVRFHCGMCNRPVDSIHVNETWRGDVFNVEVFCHHKMISFSMGKSYIQSLVDQEAESVAILFDNRSKPWVTIPRENISINDYKADIADLIWNTRDGGPA